MTTRRDFLTQTAARKGKVMAFDPARRAVLSSPPPHKEFPPAEA